MLLLLACDPDPGAPWAPGELLLEQIGLGDAAIGEAALVVGPDGTSVLLDVGNDAHADDVLGAVERHLGDRAVDWIVLTHAHADHIGSMDDLDELTVRRGVVARERARLGADANFDEWTEVEAMGLPLVDWEDTPEIDLGEGARFRILWGDASVIGGEELDVGRDENARSLGGTLTWGEFAYVWGGDTSGGGKDTPDVEGWLLDQLDLPEADVLHLDHHGIDSASNEAWLERVLPADAGVDRHALVGATGVYLSAPDDDVLDRVAPRLGGGSVWVTETGVLAGDHERRVVAHGSVVVRVLEGGDTYTIGP